MQYMTEEGLRRTLDERSMWLWSRSREEFCMAGRQGRGYDLFGLRANCDHRTARNVRTDVNPPVGTDWDRWLHEEVEKASFIMTP